MFKSLTRLFSIQTPKGPNQTFTAAKTVQGIVKDQVKNKPKLPEIFDPKKSKYSGLRAKKNLETQIQRKNAPDYLKDEQNFIETTSQSFELQNPQEVRSIKEDAEAKVKNTKRTAPSATILAKLEHKKKLESFDRFSEDFVKTYKLEQWMKQMPAKEKAAQQEAPVEDYISLLNIDQFSKTERLSKRLARMGVCSRRQAEQLIAQRMVKVDGQVVEFNAPVSNTNHIQVGAKTGMYTPIKENTRIWLFNKPQKLVTTHFDPQGRPTVFNHLKDLGLMIPHVISVGRLDFLSEGLLLITNDGELARAMEMPHYAIERQYRVRVFGRMFDDIKLKQLRAGVTMNGRKYGPYTIEIENRQNTNTWLNMKLYEGKNNEIRRVMRKFSLRVNRLQRIRYGPYTIGEVPEVGDLREVPIVPQIKHILMQYYRDRTRQASAMIEDVGNQKTVKEANKAFKNQKELGGSETESTTLSTLDDNSETEVTRWKI